MVAIIRQGMLCSASGVVGAAREVLKRELTFERLESEVVFGKIRTHAVPIQMWCEQVDGGFVFMAGLLSRVCDLLSGFGIQVDSITRTDGRPDDLPYDLSGVGVGALRQEQVQMLTAMVAHPGGVVKSPTGSGKTYVMREVCSLWPKSRIVVAAPGVETVETLFRYLDEKYPGQIGQVGAGRKFTRRVTVSTYDSLLKVGELDKIDILIADEAHCSPAKEYSQIFSAVQAPVKRFAFTATPKGRGDRAEWMMEALFGPLLVDIEYSSSVASKSVVPLKVLVLDQPWGPNDETLRWSNKDKGTERRLDDRARLAIWRNHRRNEQIAEDIRVAMAKYDNPQTLLLVNKTEHAMVLKELLPDFEVVHGDITAKRQAKLAKRGITATTITKKERETLRKRFESGDLRRVIATDVFATGVSANECQIVGIASGSGSVIKCIQSIGRGSRVDANSEKTHATCLLWKDTFARTYRTKSLQLIAAARGEGHDIVEFDSREEFAQWKC